MRIVGRMILMNNYISEKDELIKEIQNQLVELNKLLQGYEGITFEQIIMAYDLQFRLKCKLYELRNGRE